MEKKQEVLNYIKEEFKNTGFVPSKSELSARFGIANGGPINRFFNKLAEDGEVILKDGGTGYLPSDYKELISGNSSSLTMEDFLALTDKIEEYEKIIFAKEILVSGLEEKVEKLNYIVSERDKEIAVMIDSMNDSQRKLYNIQEQNRRRQRDYKERVRRKKKIKK